jgi:hypothetical protein
MTATLGCVQTAQQLCLSLPSYGLKTIDVAYHTAGTPNHTALELIAVFGGIALVCLAVGLIAKVMD